MIESRGLYQHTAGREEIAVTEDGGTHYVSCAMPILAGGDIIGCVLSGWQPGTDESGRIAPEIESKLIQTAGIFLGRQMET